MAVSFPSRTNVKCAKQYLVVYGNSRIFFDRFKMYQILTKSEHVLFVSATMQWRRGCCFAEAEEHIWRRVRPLFKMSSSWWAGRFVCCVFVCGFVHVCSAFASSKAQSFWKKGTAEVHQVSRLRLRFCLTDPSTHPTLAPVLDDLRIRLNISHIAVKQKQQKKYEVEFLWTRESRSQTLRGGTV